MQYNNKQGPGRVAGWFEQNRVRADRGQRPLTCAVCSLGDKETTENEEKGGPVSGQATETHKRGDIDPRSGRVIYLLIVSHTHARTHKQIGRAHV